MRKSKSHEKTKRTLESEDLRQRQLNKTERQWHKDFDSDRDSGRDKSTRQRKKDCDRDRDRGSDKSTKQKDSDIKTSIETMTEVMTNQQVAQGQYVDSDTCCPALSDCELEWGEAGQRPRRGRSPVEHRGTFVRPTWRSGWDAIEGWLKAFKSLNWGLRRLI